MIVDVTSEPEDGEEREIWRFTYLPDSLRLRFTRYEKGSAVWVYPNSSYPATLERPKPPAWVLVEARQIITQKITFDL
jgi:hypothetical protein